MSAENWLYVVRDSCNPKHQFGVRRFDHRLSDQEIDTLLKEALGVATSILGFSVYAEEYRVLGTPTARQPTPAYFRGATP